MYKWLAIALVMVLVPGADLSAKTLKIATISPDGLAWMKQLRAGAKEIEGRTDGRLKFKIYPGGVQGDELTVLRKMRIGQLHGGVVTAGTLTRFSNEVQIYGLPLQFRSRKEVDHVREHIDRRIISSLDDGGIVSYALIETGFAYVLSTKPVRNVDDLRSLKVWIPDQDPVSLKILQEFNVAPVPLQITDVLAGLQTGLVNAVTVPPLVALALQWHNHVSYVTELPVMYIYSMLALDKKALRSVSTEDQAILREVMDRVFGDVDALNRKDNQAAYQALLAQGIKPVQPTLSELPAWRSEAARITRELIAEGTVPQGGVDAVSALLGTLRDAGEAPATGIAP